MVADCNVRLIVNSKSITDICGENTQVMVYGATHAGWGTVIEILAQEKSPLKDMLVCDAMGTVEGTPKTLEGRVIEKVVSSNKLKGLCKSAIVNILFENFKRKKEGLPLLQIIFSLNIVSEGEAPVPLNIDEILGKYGVAAHHTTSAELRRLYRCFQMMPNLVSESVKFIHLKKPTKDYGAEEDLIENRYMDCDDEDEPLELEKFLKQGSLLREDVEKNRHLYEWSFVPVEAPWKNPQWTAAWRERIIRYSSSRKMKPPEQDWRVQLDKLIKAYNAAHPNL